jgi:acetate kinase
VDRIIGYIGSYFVKLGGRIDAMVFSGGIGENSAYLRAEVLRKAECLGFALDERRNNEATGEVRRISSKGITVLVCSTDEEGEMAQSVI